mgnify:CR=1 FL=1
MPWLKPCPSSSVDGWKESQPLAKRFQETGVTFRTLLLTLPALLAAGLLRHASHFFTLPAGY